MSGVKGRSGRRPYSEELEIEKILNLSNKTILHYLSDEKYPLKDRATLATEFSKRRVKERKSVDTTLISQQEQGIIDQYVQLGIQRIEMTTPMLPEA